MLTYRRWRAVENFIEGVRIKIPALECLTEKDDFGKNLVVQERIVTVKGLAYMREPSVDQSGKQTRDRIGKLEWLGPPERIPSNARDLRFPCPELLGKTLISVEEYYNKSMLYPSMYLKVLTTSQSMGIVSTMQIKDSMSSIVVRVVEILGGTIGLIQKSRYRG